MALLRVWVSLTIGLTCCAQLVLGTCKPPTLDTLKIKGGRYNSSGIYQEGQKLNLECLPGFTRTAFLLNGTGQTIRLSNFSITCLKNGSWSHIPKCRPRPCPNLGELLNGNIVLNESSLEFGGKAVFKCIDGYKLIGEAVIYCVVTTDKTVGWSGTLPSCEKSKCIPPSSATTVNILNPKDVYEYLEVVRFECKNKSFTLIGSPNNICYQDSKWSHDPPECKYIRCRRPEILNGRINEAGYYRKYNETMTIHCAEGYKVNGNNILTCTEDNSWDPKPLPKCIQVNTFKSTTLRTSTKPHFAISTASRLTSNTLNKKPRPPPFDWMPSLPGVGTPIILVTLCVIIFIVIGLVAVFLNKS
nr:homolog of EHV2 E3 membrane protein E3 [Macronycteris gammaherpesvirus 1]